MNKSRGLNYRFAGIWLIAWTAGVMSTSSAQTTATHSTGSGEPSTQLPQANGPARADSPASALHLQEPTVFFDDKKNWGRATRMIRPQYPESLLSQGIVGVVDVTLEVDPGGSVRKIRQMTSTPMNPLMEQALQRVLPRWRFQPPMKLDCQSTESVIDLRVHFEINAGKPKVFVTHGAAPASERKTGAAPSANPVLLNRQQVNRRLLKLFPRSAGGAGEEAIVNIGVTVDNATGKVIKVDGAQVLSHPRFADAYAQAATRAVQLAEFRPNLPGLAGVWKYCFAIEFAIDGMNE